MVSVSGAAGNKAASQSGQSSTNSNDQYARMAAQRQGVLGQVVQPGPTSSRLQGGWESAQAYSRPGPPQVNPGFMPGTQPVWPPGSLQYMQPQVYMYPGLPGNPPGFFPPQSLHGAQRPVQQMMPQVGMMIPGQQYSGMNPVYPFGMGPSPTPEQWMQARHRPQAAVFQGVRPMGWGGVPFQSPPSDPRWQANHKPVAASLHPRRPDRLSQQQPPPPPPRTASGQHLASLDRHMSQPVQRPTLSDPQTASRANSSPAIPHAPPQAEQQAEPHKEQPEQSDQQVAAGAQPAVGKVPCAFFLKTGTCAYGDKCKFEHPWDKLPIVRFNSMGLPLRQGQPECAYYLRHGRCGFGPSCKFHHPEPGTAGAPAATADSETAAYTEQAPTSSPLPDAAVAHPQSEQQQDATGTVSPQTEDSAQADMPPASISTQAQQPQSFIMAQPQYVMPASAHPQYPSTTTYPQLPQPEAGLGQGPQVPQMQYVTTASPLFPQAQYASAGSPQQQQVPLASSAALQPAALAFQQAYATTAVAPTPAPTAALGSPQQPQSTEAGEQAQPQPSGSVPVAQPQLQFQAQTAQGTPLPHATVVAQQYQPPLRAASMPVGTSESLQPQYQQQQQQQQQGPIATVPVGVVSTPQGHVAASVPVVQAQLQQFVLGPAPGVTAPPSTWPEPQLQQQQQQLPQQQPAPHQVLQQQSQVLQPTQQLQQQPPLPVPGQTMLSAQQLVAANQMSPGQATVPAQQVMLTQALPQTVPMLLSLSAAMTQPVQLVPTQGVMQAPPVPGLTPLEHVPNQAGSPLKKAEDSQLNDMSAGLPSLTGKQGLKPLSPFDSESLSGPSVATPAQSEASLATASTTSTSTSFTLKSDTTIDIDTAKAIEAVRNSLGAKDGAGLTLDQLTKRAQAKES